MLRRTAGESIVGSILQPRDDYEAAIEKVNETPPEEDNLKPNQDFMCPISHMLMSDPWITNVGSSDEKSEIERWVRTNQTDPTTGVTLKNRKLVPNRTLKRIVQRWREAHPEYQD